MKAIALIKEFKLLRIPLLTICYDGLYDNYLLFGKFIVYRKENDRDFWNDWE